MKFKIVEVRQKVQEIELAKTGKLEAVSGMMNSIAAIGGALGVKTQALYTITGMIGNIKSIIADGKKLFNIRQKSYGLGSNELKLVSIIRENKFALYKDIEEYVKDAIIYEAPKPPTSTPEEETNLPTEATGRTPEEDAELLKQIIGGLQEMGYAKDAKKYALETMRTLPKINNLEVLIKKALKIRGGK